MPDETPLDSPADYWLRVARWGLTLHLIASVLPLDAGVFGIYVMSARLLELRWDTIVFMAGQSSAATGAYALLAAYAVPAVLVPIPLLIASFPLEKRADVPIPAWNHVRLALGFAWLFATALPLLLLVRVLPPYTPANDLTFTSMSVTLSLHAALGGLLLLIARDKRGTRTEYLALIALPLFIMAARYSTMLFLVFSRNLPLPFQICGFMLLLSTVITAAGWIGWWRASAR
jgi:hypothetical protein